MSLWYVYVIETQCGCLYTGISTDIERRFVEHLKVYKGDKCTKGAKYFRTREPKQVVYRESYTSRSAALKREWQIKKLTRKQKQGLIAT